MKTVNNKRYRLSKLQRWILTKLWEEDPETQGKSPWELVRHTEPTEDVLKRWRTVLCMMGEIRDPAFEATHECRKHGPYVLALYIRDEMTELRNGMLLCIKNTHGRIFTDPVLYYFFEEGWIVYESLECASKAECQDKASQYAESFVARSGHRITTADILLGFYGLGNEDHIKQGFHHGAFRDHASEKVAISRSLDTLRDRGLIRLSQRSAVAFRRGLYESSITHALTEAGADFCRTLTKRREALSEPPRPKPAPAPELAFRDDNVSF